jgi:hypothetical protein
MSHVGVQVNPDEHALVDVEKARDYLQQYFEKAKITIFWGSAEDFLKQLRTQLATQATVEVAIPAAAGEGEWVRV